MDIKKILFLFLSPVVLINTQGQLTNDTTVLARLRSAAKDNNVIQKTITQLCDLYGPRLMGTNNYYRSASWAREQLRSFGADTAWLESFDKQYRGWNIRSFNVEMTAPNYMHLQAYPLAYTKSTPGTVNAPVVYLADNKGLASLKGKLKGKVLLLGDHFESFHAAQQILSSRISASTLRQAADNPDPNDLMIGYHSRRSTSAAIAGQENRRKELQQFFRFCETEGVVALIEPSDYPYGILHSDGNHHVPAYTKQDEIRPVASFVVANEHFGRLVRLINAGITPVLRLNLEVVFNYNPAYNVNVMADLRGVDPKVSTQQVIIGAHLDSWHGGTGAADNAAGCAVMMEAIRLIKAAALQPRRTIKICLWGGEEQNFAGSGAYVADHVGNLTTGITKKDFSQISACFNLDNGTGKIRGIYAQGNAQLKPALEQWLSPFAISGGNTVTIQYANQTDHELFDALNIPAFQFIQDPLNYISAVHHTTMDVAEYVNQNDLQENAILIAYLIYQVAMQDDLLPRRDFISIVPSLQGNTTFFLKGFGEAASVSLVSDFNNWNMFGTPLAKVNGGWTCRLNLKPGRYLYKYIIDGNWTPDPATPTDKLRSDGKGHAGLTELTVP